jgi:ABC-type dipeptide/oligopeptide/nickel transport system permease component
MHGDLGISLKSRLPVWEEFVPRFKATLELGVCAMIFAVAVGIRWVYLLPLSAAPFSITPPLAWR